MLVTNESLENIRNAFGQTTYFGRLDPEEIRSRWEHARSYDVRTGEDIDVDVVRIFLFVELKEEFDLHESPRSVLQPVIDRLENLGYNLQNEFVKFFPR